MSDAATDRTVILSNAPAGRSDRLFACTVIAVSGAIFLLLGPLAKWPLGQVPAFIPIYQSALVINDVITVVFLLGQRHFSRSNDSAYSPAATSSPRRFRSSMGSHSPDCSRQAACWAPGRRLPHGSISSGMAAFRFSSSPMPGMAPAKARHGAAGSRC
jgi:hypothetical protein